MAGMGGGMSIEARVRQLSGFEVLDIATDSLAQVGNARISEFKTVTGRGAMGVTIYEPSDDDLRGIVAACQGELDRRAGLAEGVTS